MATLIIKECRKCGTAFYDNQENTTLKPGEVVYITKGRVSGCQHCPDNFGPRAYYD